MDGITLVGVALGLSMDAFAVSISNTMCYKNMRRRQALAASASFGFFQGLMPLVGFLAGQLIHGWIQAVDHWVALVLLGFIGGKMIIEGIRALRKPGDAPRQECYSLRAMLLQALATSIDALAVGISLAALSGGILVPALVIAVITFVVCNAGSELGRKFGVLLGDWAQITGGGVLVGIGVKIFVEHTLGG